MSMKAKYDEDSNNFSCNISISGGNICYVAQTVFFAICSISMYMLYSEANVIAAKVPGDGMDRFNLLWCTVLLLLLNETFFIPERFRKTCRIVAAFLVWNNMEEAGCAAKKFFNDVKSDEQTAFTGDQIRITRAGMFGVMLSIVGSYLASYLLPNGRARSGFTSFRFKSCVVQTVFYCIVAGLLLIASFVQWSRDDTCGTSAAAASFKNYNSTLLFVAFWILFGVSTNDGNTLDIALSILCAELVQGRPTPFVHSNNTEDETKLTVIYSLVFGSAMLMIIGSMLHSGIWLGGFKTEGALGRMVSKSFVLHIVSLILGIAGSACIFSKTDDKDQLWVAFFTGWFCPLLGILAHVFDAEAALIPSIFYVPAAFGYYGDKFALTSAFAGDKYLTGYVRAGTLLLMVVPIISTLLFYSRDIKVQSFDQYLKSDGAAALKAAFLLLLSSALLWKSSIGAFWGVVFIALLIFAASYNPQSALPKAALLLCVHAATVPPLWLLGNNTGLTTLPIVALFLGLWMYIGAFSTSSGQVLTVMEVYHNGAGDDQAGGDDAGRGPGARGLLDANGNPASDGSSAPPAVSSGYQAIGDSTSASGPLLSPPANDRR